VKNCFFILAISDSCIVNLKHSDAIFKTFFILYLYVFHLLSSFKLEFLLSKPKSINLYKLFFQMIFMKFMFKYLLFGVLLLILITEGVHAQQMRAGIVAFYNLENLFDTINTPGVNDIEYTPESAKRWNSERYWAKIDMIADVISRLGAPEGVPGPAVIGLCEMENRAVLEDLVKSKHIRHLNYQIVHYDSPDRRGIDVALLYQARYFRVTNSKSFPLLVQGDSGSRLFTRDQLVVSGVFDGEPMHFIVNHWPSRFGGEQRSSPARNEAAKLSRILLDSIASIEKYARVIVMGDLNDDPTDESIQVHLNANSDRNRLKAGQLYNTMGPLYKKGVGTLAYRDKWNLFDQIIITQSFLGKNENRYRYHSARVFNEQFLAQQEGRFKGYPWRTYVGNNYHGGYSDHFPVYIMLVKEVRSE
jgi:hypothetical protein